MIHVARESQCPQLKFYVLPISDRTESKSKMSDKQITWSEGIR